MNIDKLKTRREKLAAQIKEIDAAIAKAERAARAAEQRELVKMIQAHGITAARLSQLLDTAPASSEQSETQDD